jgi:hypothetical protein
MSGQGYHLAISKGQSDELLNSGSEFAALDAVNDLLGHMEASQPGNVHGGYKEWDVLHRCLSDGTFNPRGGTYPLNQCFLGGQLLACEGAIVNLVMPDVVQDVALALGRLDREWFVARFTALFAADYSGAIPDEDYQHYYELLQDLHRFYVCSAAGRKAIAFYTDDCLSYFFNPPTDQGASP